MKYRPDIDGLRAVAVLAVVLHHLSPELVPGGYIGVDVFFVISGYLITSILSREIEAGTFTFTRFYERRIRRLFPALFAMLAATLVAGWFLLLPSDYFATFRAALGTVFFSSNIVFWKSMAAGYFAADAKLNPLLHTWSLAVEEQFYLFFPILLLACSRYARRHLVVIMSVCAVVTLVAASLLVRDHQVAVFFLSPFRAWELLAGVLLALNAVPGFSSRALREVVAGAGLLAIVASTFFYDTHTLFPGLAALAPVLGAAAIIHAGSGGSTFVGRALQWRPVAYIGLISYSLYLWHWPLIVLTRFAIGMDSLGPYVPVLLAGSLLLGSLSYHLIERPFRHTSGSPRSNVFVGAIAVAAVLVAASAFGYIRSGFSERFDTQIIALDDARAQKVPYQECDRRPEWCLIGATSVAPTVLLWGDSHMLAWAPALDRIYAAQGRSVLLALTTACPPLLEVENGDFADCLKSSRKVRWFLEKDNAIQVVVVAAYWDNYVGNKFPMKDAGPKSENPNKEPAVTGLKRTLSWLAGLNREAYLIGPVPAYDKNVPLAVALEYAQGRSLISMTMNEHRDKHAWFFRIADTSDKSRIQFVDPSRWICKPVCLVEDAGVLYRDGNHLSVHGALALMPDLKISLNNRNTASIVKAKDSEPSIGGSVR